MPPTYHDIGRALAPCPPPASCSHAYVISKRKCINRTILTPSFRAEFIIFNKKCEVNYITNTDFLGLINNLVHQPGLT